MASHMYDLPYQIKMKNENHKASHCYMSMVVQGIDYATELQACQDFAKLLWPQGNDPLSQSTHMYAMALAELDHTVMKMLYESYGMDERKHSASHSESTRYLLRLLSYRRQRDGEANTAFVSHTDKSFMSILHQNHDRSMGRVYTVANKIRPSRRHGSHGETLNSVGVVPKGI